ncbi:copper resistance protein CopD [Pseudomonas sp. Leaf129]|uniref:copper homeostasis membrane protein CopD n=1 Tax=Pseudomonas sp. Leaf129 TaxID=1736268 RepID=UPI000702955E|nr:copper homeostasis membrane protein CopD [Pseudomonas sp. Leaf129]KQQ63342.1 copper resistance protein CopD [Pseudomonas sp. Leaf129]
MSVLIVLRFLHFTSLMLVFGACMFRPLLLDQPGQKGRLRNLIDPLVCLLAALALISGVAWLFAVAFEMGGSLDMALVRRVLGETFFGKVWTLHLFACVAVLVCLRIPHPKLQVVARPLSALALATLAPVGHAAMFEGSAGIWLVINQLIHLLCVGAWLGGLMLLMFVLARPGDQDLRVVLGRFSGVGCVLVAGLLVTGLINTRALTGSFLPVPSASGFATVLAVKLALVLAMLGLAVWHRRQLARGPVDVQSFKRTVTLEWACGLGAVAAVALLGTLAPTPLG